MNRMSPLNAVQMPAITVMIAAPVGLLPYDGWYDGLGARGVSISAIINPTPIINKLSVKSS